MTRKCILIGGLVFVERTVDKCMVAVCVSLVNLGLLAYFRPHPLEAVFGVEIISFFFTCMKYFSVVMLNIKEITKSAQTTTDNMNDLVVLRKARKTPGDTSAPYVDSKPLSDAEIQHLPCMVQWLTFYRNNMT